MDKGQILMAGVLLLSFFVFFVTVEFNRSGARDGAEVVYQEEVQHASSSVEEVVSTSTVETSDSIPPKITFSDFNNEIEGIPQLPTEEEWGAFVEDNDVFALRYKIDEPEYANILKRFHMSYHFPSYIDITEADVTGDGQPELILAFSSGGNFGVEEYKIVQNNEVIATVWSGSTLSGGLLIPNPSGNGFVKTWYTADMFPEARCCPVSRMETVFEFVDGKFIPVSEHKIDLTTETSR